MNWSKCIVCGKGDGELKCPADRVTGGASESYGKFLENVKGFRTQNKLPMDLAIPENVTLSELIHNHAKWHKTCQLKFASSKLERIMQQKCKKDISNEPDRKSRRLSSGLSSTGRTIQTSCVFCSEENGILHNCSTLSLDKSLRQMATDLQDTHLLSRTAGGDLVAIEAKYHNKCLTSFKNRHRNMVRRDHSGSKQISDTLLDARVFAELTAYIEYEIEDGEYIFRLSDLHKLYVDRLDSLGLKKQINKTRLKEKILEYFKTECQEQSDGNKTILVFNEGMQRLLKDTMKSRDFDQEAMAMARLSKSVRKEITDGAFFKFSGSFQNSCEENSIPAGLKYLISMILYGANIKDTEKESSRACLTICQLIMFNFKGKFSKTANPRHDNVREPPLPVYIGLDIHTHTRSRKLITELSQLGLSIGYQRVLEIENKMTDAVCQRYLTNDLVCPLELRSGIPTVGALDNIDHNPSSTTAKGSFHGTSISIFQCPLPSSSGTSRDGINLLMDECKLRPSLPDSYTLVPATCCKTSLVTVPESNMQDVKGNIEAEIAKEKEWLESSIPLLSKEKLEKGDFISWHAYHASKQPDCDIQPGISSLLPLFSEKAATVSMVKHGMTVIRSIIAECNPGQIPVIAVDQPLYALAKTIQWCWPNTHGENMYVVLLGGLHIELALWRVVGDLLDSSGWTELLVDAEVANPGIADSFISSIHLKRTRRAHQITALALARLQREACKTLTGRDDEEAFTAWRDDMVKQSPTFHFWDLILRLEMLVLIFVRAHRESNFMLYVEVLEILAPFFFILDHTNYARWLPVHIRDMKSLPDNAKQDVQNCWTFQKTRNKFSAMPIDQAHEQNNKIIKDSGGAVGLTENPSALKRWMISGPEQMRLLKEFGDNGQCKTVKDSHEQGYAAQESFQINVNNLCQTMLNLGSPFLEESGELLRIDNHDVVDTAVKDAMKTIEIDAQRQYERYCKSVLVDRVTPIQSPIKKNRIPLFKRPPYKEKKLVKGKITELRSDYSLFSQLFIASQVREGDLNEFFAHENHPWPPSLSQHGKLRLPTCKSELLTCLCVQDVDEKPLCDTKIFDGAAIVHALPVCEAKTFEEYSQNVFVPWVRKQLDDCRRVDIVWDTYKENSLKDATREKRGTGTRKKVSRRTRMPNNFMSFLRDSRNKTELFALLSDDIANSDICSDNEIYITSGKSVVVKGGGLEMSETDQEEADTRLCLHVQDAILKGAKKLVVSTVDTDVVIILIGVFSLLKRLATGIELWVEFGKGKNLKYFNINYVCEKLGEDVSKSLPFFHAFTGCDTTSQFGGKGKKQHGRYGNHSPR